ncbi:MAG: hypothetical protein WA175_03625 [Candidatus Acidiferrales bacterium]
MPSPYKKITCPLLVILFLLPFPSLAQEKQAATDKTQTAQGQTPAPNTRTEASDSYGSGGARETDYDDDGNATAIRDYDSKGALREVTYYTYHPGTKKIDHKERHYLDANGSTETRVDEHWAPDGSQIDSEIKDYGPHGSTAGGRKRDFVNHKKYIWDPSTQDWLEAIPGYYMTTQELEQSRTIEGMMKRRDEEIMKIQKERDEEAKERQKYNDKLQKEHDDWKKNHPDSASPTPLAPTNLGIISPVNVNPGEDSSASIMPAKDALAYSSVPGLTVTTFTVPMPTEPGLVDDGWYPGLVLCTTNPVNCAPADEGSFTIHIPPGSSAVNIEARQANDPYFSFRFDFPITKPSYAGSPYLNGLPMITSYQNWLKDELDWAWDEVLDIKDELAYARAHGAPADYIGWLLDELDDAYDYEDEVADELSAKTVHDLALFKAGRAQFLLDNHYYTTFWDLDSLQREVNYFHDEANYEWRNYIGWFPGEYTTQPFAQVGRLDVIRGPFTGDCSRTHISIDHWPVTFIGQDTRETYFMLPDWVLPGAHTLYLSQGHLDYTWLVFVMQLTMSIDTPNLHLLTYPQSTMWHLTVTTGTTGSNATLASDLSAGGSSPDLFSLGSIPKLPQGFQLPNQTSPGQIVVTATNLSTNIISIPQMPGGQQTWVLGAQNIDPSGEFHVDYDASALSHGDFTITGRAVAMVKPKEATPLLPTGEEAPLNESNTSNVSDKTPQQLADEAKQRYDQAITDTLNKRNALRDAWDRIVNSAPKDILRICNDASFYFDALDDNWQKAKDAYDRDPSDANNKAVYQTSEKRYRAKIAYEKARENLLDSVDPKLSDAWRRANGDYDEALWREGMAKEGWQDAQKEAAEKAVK